jgi:HEAT repeat protein
MWKNNRNLVLVIALLAATAVPAVAQEAKLIAVLKSSATQEEKSAACRLLARIATKKSVPTLAVLLGDEKLSHMARYAMEGIPDPSVGDALRDALGKLQGRPLMGVIGSLGVRRDAKAVDAIAKLLTGADAAVAQAAARALGNIGTPEAAKALDAALADASGASQLALCEGLFRCAEALSTEGQAQSQVIYDRVRGLTQAPQQVRVAALRGAILSRGKAGIPLMLEAVRGPNYALTAAAARTAMELPGPEVTAALGGELPKLPVDKQVLLMNTLGYRGDASAGPALLALASKGPAVVRVVAVQNLTHLGYAPALPLLAELSLAGKADLSAAAQTCLSNFPGHDADAAILAMLAHKDAKVRSLAVQMIGQRNIAGSIANLLKATDDAEESVRQAAFRELRQQARATELSALLKLLVKARSQGDVQAAEGVLLALCARESKPAGGNVVIIKAVYGASSPGLSADVTKQVAALVKAGTLAIEASNDNFGDPAQGHSKELRVDYKVNGAIGSKTVHEQETLTITSVSTPPAIGAAICGAVEEARGEAKLALLRTLRTAGGPKALETLRAALADSDPQVKDTALHILCDWPTPDALPQIIDLVAAPPTPSIKVLALRGLVRLVPQDDAPDAKKFDTLKRAMTLADRNEERQLVLSALANVPTADALALVASCLENAVLKEEACTAAVSIAEKVAPNRDAAVTAVMEQVAKTTANKELAARANSIAGKAKK